MPTKTQPIINPIFVSVALPVPLRKSFDYLPPIDQEQLNLQPGIRVIVPFGNKKIVGIVVALNAATAVPLHKLKAISTIIDPHPIFSPKLLELLIWASQYYQYPFGLVAEAALTQPLRVGTALSQYQQLFWRVQHDLDLTNIIVKSQQQHQLLKLLTTIPAGISALSLLQQGFTKTLCTKLAAKKLITSYYADPEQALALAANPTMPLQLNSAQQQALLTIVNNLNKFQTFLLDGITGSGKTEIYMQAIAQVIAQGKQALLLVPEISLTPQTLQQLQQRFNTQIVAYHSKITAKAKTLAWIQAKSGIAKIIIGTRSAAFIPLQDPGIFVIDEEHDQSFKQQEGFRYSARDLLIKRAQLEQCPIILGSATPALETLWNAKQQRYLHLKLPARAGGAVLPKVTILDIRHKKLKYGLALPLLETIKQHLEQKGQVLLFLNRRGYAPVLFCGNCNWIANCSQCSIRMILHFYPKPHLLCHHCQTKIALPSNCPKCQSTKLAPLGFGTEKLEQVLKTQFPQANIVRVDSDNTRKTNALADILEQVHSGHANILLGTQMLAKGHHFPGLSLVAILDIDSALFSADFRNLERMGQLVTQVAGRAGRGELPGQVVLQTANPEHPLLITLLHQGYHTLGEQLLLERRAANLPPFSYQILFRAATKSAQTTLKFLQSLKQGLSIAEAKLVFGPILAPIEKKANLFHGQLLLQASRRIEVQQLATKLLDHLASAPPPSAIKWSIDVDPLDFY